MSSQSTCQGTAAPREAEAEAARLYSVPTAVARELAEADESATRPPSTMSRRS